MYISRVELDTDNRQKIRDLTHLGAFHSWVENSFPDEAGSNNRSRKLWRLDSLSGRLWLIVVSEKEPDLVRLERYGIRGTAETKDYGAFLKNIHNGMHCRFRLVLNPAYSVSQGPGVRGRVYPEVTVSQQLDYLEKRAEKYGFELINGRYRITERSYEILRKPQMRPVHLCKVTYEGELLVVSEDIFRNMLIKGMGKKKAYGFGMMTVIPV
ncbi:MAG: type I-E CRISPR-associated protein Cas6/Cse3/CasE [Lachnospiraceae bacterium]|nr:type I-E CRISPR-associated protein Cas6/Cse3/CasE [Lachnospiraceae bacterium]